MSAYPPGNGDTENIRFVFAAVRDTILQHNLKEYNLSLQSSETKKTLTTKRKCFKNATVARRSKTKQGKAMHKAKQNFRQQQQQQQQRYQYQYHYYNITIRFGKTIVSKSQPLTCAFFPSMFSIMLEQEVKYDELKCDKRPKTEGDQAGKYQYQYHYYNITIRFGKTIVSKSQPLTCAFFPSMFSIMLEQEVKYDELKCDKRPKTEGDQAGKVGGREKENTRIKTEWCVCRS
ncbi:Guanine nucleotide-binding protein subunit alpha-11 [Trichinella murrelli]|uniref:Guanine nucleotide-binding protein subunit alpha-11 n=1 Tax=Trichinella murrelli TaxID=144512 RepID=A0A0V0TQ98_9BILA|nr:Guanine nucleotide-binding protein subunit alpha-11 [Trichinella murrelli]